MEHETNELQLVKSGLCRSHSVSVNIALTSSTLSWSLAANLHKFYTKSRGSIPIHKILTCTCTDSKANGNTGDLHVHYIDIKKFVLKIKSVVFCGTFENCELWAHRIVEAVTQNCPQRPKRLLVFINPISGRTQGERVYNAKVAPVFQLCKVHADVRVTERAHHVEEILATYDLTSVDGLVSVGGDGTYAEVANGLIRRTAKDAGIDDINQDVELPQPSLPMGIIATGTGNGIAACLHGTNDATTAALRIIMGDAVAKDVSSVRCEGKLLCYSILQACWGMFSHIIYWAEAHRSALNIFRYGIMIPRACCPNMVIFTADVEYEEIVSKLPEPNAIAASTKAEGTANDESCRQSTTSATEHTVHTAGSRTSDTANDIPDHTATKRENERQTTGSHEHSTDVTEHMSRDAAEADVVPYLIEYETVKKSVSGPYIHINAWMADWMSRKENSLGNGQLTMGLMKPCGCWRHAMNWVQVIKMAGRSLRSERKIENPCMVACYAHSMRARATGDFADSKHATYINCDGDVLRLPAPEFEVRMYRGLTQLYGAWTYPK